MTALGYRNKQDTNRHKIILNPARNQDLSQTVKRIISNLAHKNLYLKPLGAHIALTLTQTSLPPPQKKEEINKPSEQSLSKRDPPQIFQTLLHRCLRFHII
jgi:hypothetical protein